MIWILFILTIISFITQLHFINEASYNQEIIKKLLCIIAEGNKLNKLRHDLLTNGFIDLEDYLDNNGNITD